MVSTGIPLLPPAEAIAFFRAKGFKVGFAWQDVWQEEHAHAFTVAKAMSADVLQTIRTAVDDAIANGRTLEQFRTGLTPLLEELGWWGPKRMIDPATGQARTVQLGSPRRLKIIYDMNLRMARAAGLWTKIQRTKSALPYLRYTAVMDERTRPEHAEWHGTILPVDDPWWDAHYPPCGWNCRCTVIQLDAGTIEDRGWSISDAPPPSGPDKPWTNPRTGEKIDVPAGIDPGFGYNVGKAPLGGVTPPPLLPRDLPELEAGIAPVTPPSSAPEPPGLLPPDVSDQEAIDAFLQEALAPPPAGPVSELSGTEIAPADASIEDLRDAAMRFLRDLEPAVNPDLGEVMFSRRGAKKAVDQSPERFGGADKLRATPAVPDVIRLGTVDMIAPNEKFGAKPGVLAYARITAPIRLAGEVQTMEVLVEQQPNGQWFYNHRLPKAQSGRPLQSGGVSDGAAEETDGRTVPKSGGRSASEDIASPDADVEAVRYDPSGWPLAIGRSWFRDAGGATILPGDQRALRLVGRALAKPEQIRLRWVVGADGVPQLFRRYLAHVEGIAIVVDVGKTGWRFATARDAGFDWAKLATGVIVWPAPR